VTEQLLERASRLLTRGCGGLTGFGEEVVRPATFACLDG
jgi:hypothetical protein